MPRCGEAASLHPVPACDWLHMSQRQRPAGDALLADPRVRTVARRPREGGNGPSGSLPFIDFCLMAGFNEGPMRGREREPTAFLATMCWIAPSSSVVQKGPAVRSGSSTDGFMVHGGLGAQALRCPGAISRTLWPFGTIGVPLPTPPPPSPSPSPEPILVVPGCMMSQRAP